MRIILAMIVASVVTMGAAQVAQTDCVDRVVNSVTLGIDTGDQDGEPVTVCVVQ